MAIPQIILIIVTAVGLLGAAHFHGKPRENYNFWMVLLGDVILFGLLIWGGFFS